MFDKRISIFTGHFGSGKTEVAVNYAIKLSERHKPTAIVDFDIVNPFFRTADAKKNLEEKGILVLAPMYANTNVDVPSLPAEINMLFEKKDYKAVFDVGGDDLGAKVLSRYNESFLNDDYEMFFVINTRRPMTLSEKGIEQMIWEIEESSRLKVTWLVNNTNLLGETKPEDILEGGALIGEVSKKLDIPVAFVSGMATVIKDLGDRVGVDRLYMDKYIRLPWDKEY
jgi:ATPases involved in chromosome partitioning